MPIRIDDPGHVVVAKPDTGRSCFTRDMAGIACMLEKIGDAIGKMIHETMPRPRKELR